MILMHMGENSGTKESSLSTHNFSQIPLYVVLCKIVLGLMKYAYF